MSKLIGFVQGLPIYEIRAETAHDPHNGQFTSGAGGSSHYTDQKIPDSARLSYEVKRNPHRSFFDAALKESAKTWLDLPGKHSSNDRVQITVDHNAAIGSAHINRIDVVNQKGKGFGKEALSHVIHILTSEGIHHITAYIEHENLASQHLFEGLGFKKGAIKKDGATWALNHAQSTK